MARDRLESEASLISTVDYVESNSKSPAPLVWTLTFVASISGFLFGYDTGYISSVLVTIGTDLGGKELTIKQREYVSSATSFGALIASLFIAGILADVVGRKFTILLCDVLFIVGTTIQYFAVTVSEMIFGRFIMGLGVGIGSFCAPLYIAELAPSKFRGKLVTINCLAITGGQLIAYSVGAFLSDSINGWRKIVAVSFIPSVIQFLAICFLPDTPRFLIMVNKVNEATKVLQKIYPVATQSTISEYIEELQNLSKQCRDNESIFKKIKDASIDLFTKNSNKRALIIACGLQGIQQFVGFNALMYFSSSIFQMVGFENSTLISCFIAGTNFIITIVALLIIDKIGRRNILLYSIICLIISQILCSFSFYKIDSNDTTSNSWKYFLLFSLILFVAFYSIGLGNVPWQQSELFPQNVRGIGSSLSTSTNWFGSMTLSFFFLSLMNSISPSLTFLLFSFNSLLSFIFVYYLYPELSGLSLEQVQYLLKDGFKVDESVELYKQYSTYSGIPQNDISLN